MFFAFWLISNPQASSVAVCSHRSRMSPQRMESHSQPLPKSLSCHLSSQHQSMNHGWLTKAASGGQAVGRTGGPEEEESVTPVVVYQTPREKGDPEGEHAVQREATGLPLDLPRSSTLYSFLSASKWLALRKNLHQLGCGQVMPALSCSPSSACLFYFRLWFELDLSFRRRKKKKKKAASLGSFGGS